jgi:hypothetical protein
MGPQQPPHERNEKDNDRNLSNTEFSFKYAESGGITNRYLLISYIHSHFIYIYILLTEALAIGVGF